MARCLRTVLVCAVLALCAPAALLAQRYTFRQYGSADGLSNVSVNCMIQDRDGYIWVGTDNGLFRYDGDRFKAFGHAQGLPNSEIHSIAQSPTGTLWVATEAGLVRSEGQQFRLVEGTAKQAFQSVEFDAAGNLYLASATEVVRGTPDMTGNYRFTSVALGDIGALFVGDEDVWFVKDRDLWRLGKFKPEQIGAIAGLPAASWSAITRNDIGDLWVRSSRLLYELPRGQTRFVDRSSGIPTASRPRLYADRHGRVFVSTNRGVVVFDGSKRTYIDPAHGLPAETASPVLLDRDESLWIGMFGGGVLRRLGHGEWLGWTTQDGLIHNSVWAIHHDPAGSLWVGTSAGLSIFNKDGKLSHTWTGRNGLAGDWVRSIVPGPDGDYYVGTSPGGVTRLSHDGIPLQSYGAASGLTTNEVVASILDRSHRLWVAGPATGIYRSSEPLDAGSRATFARVDIPGVPATTRYRNITLGPDGAVWVATADGLARYDGSGWRLFTRADGLFADDVSALAMQGNEVWVAYRDALGLSRLQFEGGHVQATRFTQQDGLSSDLIYALAFDRSGRLWATTDNGVDLFTRSRWQHYGRQDGLIWDDGNDLALSVDEDNNVWIGTSNGLSRFSSSAYLDRTSTTPVVLDSIKGAAHDFDVNDHPTLPHGQGSLLIRFSALNYAYESGSRFRYRLRGYNNAWTETSERSVHFEGLPAGHYTFEVVAANPGGDWSPVPAAFEFSIQPAWWQSWWFLTGCALTVLSLAALVWRYRVRVLVAQKERLKQQVAEQTAALIESHRQLEQLAYCDVLTGLPNRRMFTEQFRSLLAQGRRRRKPFALLLIDLDHFKRINDTYGHDAGDAVLLETARRLRLAVRESDCVARLGGDEFAILLSDPQQEAGNDQAGIELVCDRINESVAAGMPYRGDHLITACSIGIAMYPEHGETQEGLYKAADLALYEAKRGCRNSYRWHRPQEAVVG